MSSSLLRLASAAALVLAACSIGPAPLDGPTITIEIEVPDTIDWRRTVAGLEIAGSGTRPDPAELAMLEGALGEIPRDVIDRAEVRTIYRITADPAAEQDSLAFSRGPDIYLTDGTFATVAGRFELAAVLAHELAHTMQYAELTKADLEVLGGLEGPNVFTVTGFVVDFASAVGWTNRGTATAPVWELADRAGTTPYGATAPAEDMADTVSRVVMGRAGDVSPSRVAWAEDHLGLPMRELARGKPYLPAGAVEVAPPTPLYDEDRARRLSRGTIEAHSWALPETSPSLARLVREIEEELGRRGLAGTLQASDDATVARYAGEFVRSDGVVFLVEVWDFRDAPGFVDPPPQPVVTYVAP